MKLTSKKLKEIVVSVMRESPEFAPVGGKVDISGGWSQLATDSAIEHFSDPSFLETLAGDIEYKSFELEDQSYFPARVEDVEAIAGDAAKKVVSSKQFQSAVEQALAEAIARAVRSGM